MNVYSAVECNKWFNEDCQVCTKTSCLTCDKICTENEYKNVGTCECEKCSTRSKECIRCNSKLCTRCNEGYPLTNGKCSNTTCPTGSWSDGLGECKPCPAGKYCMDGLVYNKNTVSEDNSSGTYNIALDKFKREFKIITLIGAGGGGGKGNLKQTTIQKQETYQEKYQSGTQNYTTRQVCSMCNVASASCGQETFWASGNPRGLRCNTGTGSGCGAYCCTEWYQYQCNVPVYSYRDAIRTVTATSYTSYGGGGGGQGQQLHSTISIPDSIIESAWGGKLQAISGKGTSSKGESSSVVILNSSAGSLWSISATGGFKGNDATAGAVGSGGKGAASTTNFAIGSNGGSGGSATASSVSSVQGSRGAGGGFGYGAGGAGGTITVNTNGKQSETAPAIGANGYVKVTYIQLTR